MSHPSDQIAQMTFLGVDDQAFRKERERKRAPKDAAPALPDGPCCDRCTNWRRPLQLDEFGACLVLAVVEDRGQSPHERGTIVSIDQAVQDQVPEWSELSTKPWFAGCSMFWQVA